jgi:hypothetical protein
VTPVALLDIAAPPFAPFCDAPLDPVPPPPPRPIIYPLFVMVSSPFRADEIVKAAVDVLSDQI